MFRLDWPWHRRRSGAHIPPAFEIASEEHELQVLVPGIACARLFTSASLAKKLMVLKHYHHVTSGVCRLRLLCHSLQMMPQLQGLGQKTTIWPQLKESLCI